MKGNSLWKKERTGEISADSVSTCLIAGAETPLLVQKCPGKLCYSANGTLTAEHVKADALV